jgi:hypothetical protein
MTRSKIILRIFISGLALLNFTTTMKAAAEPIMLTQALLQTDAVVNHSVQSV